MKGKTPNPHDAKANLSALRPSHSQDALKKIWKAEPPEPKPSKPEKKPRKTSRK